MAEPYLQVGVKVLLKNSEGKFLFIRTNPNKYPEKGSVWDIVGGRIEIGVTLLENLKREVKEEVSLEVVENIKLVDAQDILNIDGYPGRHVVRLTFTADTEGEPKINDESTEFRWFTAEEIKALPAESLDIFFEGTRSKIFGG